MTLNFGPAAKQQHSGDGDRHHGRAHRHSAGRRRRHRGQTGAGPPVAAGDAHCRPELPGRSADSSATGRHSGAAQDAADARPGDQSGRLARAGAGAGQNDRQRQRQSSSGTDG